MSVRIVEATRGHAGVEVDGDHIGFVERYEEYSGNQTPDGIPITTERWMGYGHARGTVSYAQVGDRLSRADVSGARTRREAAEALAEALA